MCVKLISALLLFCASAVSASTPMPISVSANKRYFVDAAGHPWLMNGDSAQSLIVNLNNADTLSYVRARATNGFNCLQSDIFCTSALGAGHADGSLLDNTTPFTGHYTNGPYWDM